MLGDKKVSYSAMQSTGTLTLGNYLGALDNWLKMQEEYECFYAIADLHSLTIRQNPAELRKRARDLYALYVAAGLDPEKNCIYFQSHVSAHAVLFLLQKIFSISQTYFTPQNYNILIKNVITKLLRKSANKLPTSGMSRYAFTEGAYFSQTACMFAMAFGVAPIPNPQVPAASTAASYSPF